jgi:hypothetical protein
VSVLFDVTYTVHIDAKGGIEVKAVDVSREGDRREVETQVLRVARAGDIVKVFISHPGETAVTEIELRGRDTEIVSLSISNHKKHTHRGHVTVLK